MIAKFSIDCYKICAHIHCIILLQLATLQKTPAHKMQWLPSTHMVEILKVDFAIWVTDSMWEQPMWFHPILKG